MCYQQGCSRPCPFQSLGRSICCIHVLLVVTSSKLPGCTIDLERGDAEGKKIEEMGFKADSGGVWLNDLSAVRGDEER